MWSLSGAVVRPPLSISGKMSSPIRWPTFYAKLKRARRNHAALEASEQANIDPSNAMSLAEDRLCVVYRQNHTLQFYRPHEYASIVDSEGVEMDDIAGAQ